jgi:excisionase family DNA binding protein
MSEQRWLTPAQLCERLQVGRDTGYQILASGLIRVARVGRGGRLLRVSEAALADYVAQCESGGENSSAARVSTSPAALDGGAVHGARRRTEA